MARILIMTSTPTFLSIMLPAGADVLASKLETILLDTIALAVIDALPEEQLSAFEEVLAEGDEQKIVAFIEANVPDAREELYPLITDMTERAAALV
jgi:succinate dehydrogenase flavin-adding protein (antitoxin of CptAB toxin-antitoxin module)